MADFIGTGGGDNLIGTAADDSIEGRDGTDTVSRVAFMQFADVVRTAESLQALSKSDNFVVAQYASPDILGSGPGHDTYLLSPSLLPAGTTLRLTDTEGINSIQLAAGLDIASSQVAADALRLTLTNGSVITVLGASQFTYEAGGNSSAGLDGPDLGYSDFAQQVLGVTVPAGSAINTGGALVVGGGAALPAFPAGTKSDNFVVAQFASPDILGSGPGDDTYLLSPSLLPAGTTLRLTDTEGDNSIQLAAGLDIASSQVAADALRLTLTNGSVITVLGASQFTYEAGGNSSAGINGPDLGYAAFAQQVLGVTVPTGSAIVNGGPVLIGPSAPGGVITVPAGSTMPVAATPEADILYFDVEAARATAANTQIDITGFATANDLLRLNLPIASGSGTLDQIDGVQDVSVQVDPFAASTVINFGPDADGNVIAITLVGVTDPAQVQIEVV